MHTQAHRLRYAALAFAALMGILASRVEAAGVLSLSASTASPEVGSTFSVTLALRDLDAGRAPSLGAYDLTFVFDASLALVDLSPRDPRLGEALDPARLGTASSFLLEAPGRLRLRSISLASADALEQEQAGEFELMTLTLRALRSGLSQVSLAVHAFADAHGADLSPLLAADRLDFTIAPAVEVVAFDSVCQDTHDNFSGEPAGPIDGVLLRPGVQLGERFAGQGIETVGNLEQLSGQPSAPLSVVAGAPGENLNLRSARGLPAGIEGASPGGADLGTIAVTFAENQSEIALSLDHRSGLDIDADLIDRSGRKLDRVTLRAGPAGSGAYGLARRGRVADVAGIGLQIHPNSGDLSLGGLRLFWLRFTGDPTSCARPPEFIRGDCNGDGQTSGVLDALAMLTANFVGGVEWPCRAACDVNTDGDTRGVTDAIALLTHNFVGGVSIAAPFPTCGGSTLASDIALGCAETRCGP